MAINTGVNISKAVAYAVISEKLGVNISKTVAYAAITTIQPGVDIAKAVAFALINPINTNPPVWANSFSSGVLGASYSSSIDLTPAASPITFTQVSGTLPPGLSLSSSGTTVTLSGTPTTDGTYTFVLSASNIYGSAGNKSFTVTIIKLSSGGSWVSFT
jgi:hypothetical protein